MKNFLNAKNFFCILIVIVLQGCASSNVSRQAASNVDVGYHNAVATGENMGNGSMADSYQNSQQMTKGLIVGGAAGAVAGALTNGVGLVPGLAIGSILGGAYGAYIDSNTTSSDKLTNRGIKMIELGDQVLIVMQSNRIFNDMTAEIRPGAYSTLDRVAKYVNTFPNMSIQIAAYTSPSGPDRVNRALSQEQANAVERYLWRAGVNTRLVTAMGMGNTRPVSASDTDWDSGENYRVEITLEKLPA